MNLVGKAARGRFASAGTKSQGTICLLEDKAPDWQAIRCLQLGMGGEGKESGAIPALLSLRRSSNEAGERPKPPAAAAKKTELGVPIPSIPSTRRPFEELLTAMRKVLDLSIPSKLPEVSALGYVAPSFWCCCAHNKVSQCAQMLGLVG